MANEILNPEESYKLSPEALAFIDVYLQTFDLEETAQALEISKEEASTFVRKKEVKRFLDNVFFDQGYTSRFKLKDTLTKIIDSKLEEAEETGIYSNKDLAELLKLMIDFRKSEIALIQAENEGIKKQTNVQVNNNYSNLNSLISDLVEGNVRDK